MDKGIILHLEDRDDDIENYKKYFGQLPLKEIFQYYICKTREEFYSFIKDNENTIKCFIFDLIGSNPGKEELDDGDIKFLSVIKDSFSNYNTPIFIYSGNLDKLDGQFENNGTIFQIDKRNGIDIIFDKIKAFSDSGFLDVFCRGGILDKKIAEEMHNSFVKQFRGREIENIIKIVQDNDTVNSRKRCIDIFQRIAVRALLSKLLEPLDENPNDVNLNAVEYYYRRISSTDYWTGDILKKNDSDNYYIILTPRCDCRASDKFVICDIITDFPDASSNSKKEKIKAYLNDNIKEKQLRYIPPSPLFIGGKVDYSTHQTISKKTLTDYYSTYISLNDALTNDILAKFGTYFLRIGINPINTQELFTYLDSINENSN